MYALPIAHLCGTSGYCTHTQSRHTQCRQMSALDARDCVAQCAAYCMTTRAFAAARAHAKNAQRTNNATLRPTVPGTSGSFVFIAHLRVREYRSCRCRCRRYRREFASCRSDTRRSSRCLCVCVHWRAVFGLIGVTVSLGWMAGVRAWRLFESVFCVIPSCLSDRSDGFPIVVLFSVCRAAQIVCVW